MIELQDRRNQLNDNQGEAGGGSVFQEDDQLDFDEFEENESLLSEKKEKESKKRTEIMKGFDIDLVPSKIVNPLKERKVQDKMAITLARVFAFFNLFMIVIGIISLIISIVKPSN